MVEHSGGKPRVDGKVDRRAFSSDKAGVVDGKTWESGMRCADDGVATPVVKEEVG
jgi:hypothetical protein